MYDEIFGDVKALLAANDGEATSIGIFPFRKRSEHIWRVFLWAKRLLDEGQYDVDTKRECVLIAALFHDVGYAAALDSSRHAENGALLFEQYACDNGYDSQQRDFIAHLIRNHSNKRLLDEEDTPMELVILMEADLLDETGAMSIVWDCMMEGAQAEQSFEKTYRHMVAHSSKMLNRNPMKTAIAKEYWASKQTLLREFMRQLALDLAIG